MLFGDVGAKLVIAAVLVSTFGCLNGLILGGARLCYAMARDGLFLRSCANLHPRTGTPATALVYQGIVSIVLTFTGSYSGLLTYTMFASVLFTGLMVAAVYRLRFKQPDRPRPYRCWGYPLTPALYLLMSAAFLIYVIKGNPTGSAIGVLLIASGVPFYAIGGQGRQEQEPLARTTPVVVCRCFAEAVPEQRGKAEFPNPVRHGGCSHSTGNPG